MTAELLRDGSFPIDDDFGDVLEDVGRSLPAPAQDKGNGNGSSALVKPELDAYDQDLPAVTKAAWSAIVTANVPERLFRFGGEAARVEADEDGSLFLRPLDVDRLRGEAARAGNWVRRVNVKGRIALEKKKAHPPLAVIRDMLTVPEIPLPVLSAVIGVPTFDPDGILHSTPGYNPQSRTYFAPAVGFALRPVPESPSDGEITFARMIIADDLLADFPFTGESERAHAVGLLLLPIARNLIIGPTPLHLVEKPTPGTGASLLVDALFFPTLGRSLGSMSEGRDEDEWRKRITATLRGGAVVTLIDNLRGKLDSAAVSTAITATYWEDRKLGTSDTVRLPVRCAWVATGNNPALSSEISRRVVRIRLDAKMDRPWQRSGFQHPDLRAWVARNRADIVWAALTLIRGWLAAGRPVPPDLPTLGMFENWASVIGGILKYAGIPGFLGNLSDFYDASDSEGAEIRGFLSAWWIKHRDTSVGIATLWEIAASPDSLLPLGDKGEKSQQTRLGKLISQLRDRRYKLQEGVEVCITASGVYQGAKRWRLQGM